MECSIFLCHNELWPVDPTRAPIKQIETPIWLSLGEISRYQAGRFINRLELEPATANAVSNRLWSDDGRDHVGTARLAYRDKRIYQWLLRNRSDRAAVKDGMP